MLGFCKLQLYWFLICEVDCTCRWSLIEVYIVYNNNNNSHELSSILISSAKLKLCIKKLLILHNRMSNCLSQSIIYHTCVLSSSLTVHKENVASNPKAIIDVFEFHYLINIG